MRSTSRLPTFDSNKGTPMKPKARFNARYGQTSLQLMPPDLTSLGSIAFTPTDFKVLDAWLAEDGWPAERMDAAMLEGYLVALHVWPIQLAPGAWLPAIWGIRGWKVAAKIATRESYDRFLALVIGLSQELGRRLIDTPRAHTFVLNDECSLKSPRHFAGAAWATGFLSALEFSVNGLGSRSILSQTALESIVEIAAQRPKESAALSRVAPELREAVCALMDDRPARVPARTSRASSLVAA
jgi:yecA family protein